MKTVDASDPWLWSTFANNATNHITPKSMQGIDAVPGACASHAFTFYSLTQIGAIFPETGSWGLINP